MPDFSDEFASLFKAEDFKEGPRTMTIEKVDKVLMGPEGKQDNVLVLFVKEDKRGVKMNKTRYNDLSEMFGSKNTDDWTGRKVKFLLDPSIKFAGRRVGGIACQPAD